MPLHLLLATPLDRSADQRDDEQYREHGRDRAKRSVSQQYDCPPE